MPENVRFAILKSMQIIGATWIRFGINSTIETIFLSNEIGPVKLQSWRTSSEFEFNNLASIFTYLFVMLFNKELFLLCFDFSNS